FLWRFFDADGAVQNRCLCLWSSFAFCHRLGALQPWLYLQYLKLATNGQHGLCTEFPHLLCQRLKCSFADVPWRDRYQCSFPGHRPVDRKVNRIEKERLGTGGLSVGG